MKVRDLMEKKVISCTPDDTLDATAMLMWNNDCGSIPVIDASGTPIGIITDRDIAMSTALNHKSLWELRSSDVTNNRPLFTCNENDDISSALEAMRTNRVRRLPVVGDGGRLYGIISIDDIIARSEEKASGMSFRETMNTLKSVCVHH
jgi:CBS domain-containing protein